MKKLFTFFSIFCWVAISIFNVLRIAPLARADEPLPVAAASKVPEFYISAINPGYTVDGVSNVGEFIEIGYHPPTATDSPAADTTPPSEAHPFSLAGITVSYTNSSGNTSVLLEFSEYSFIAGEKILLRLASSPASELANLNYTKTLAFKAALSLRRGEEILDSVCWTGKDDCLAAFKSASPTTLVRNLASGDFEHLETYEPTYDEFAYVVNTPSDETASPPSQCRGLMFSEVLSYYETSQSEQFVELYNSTAEQIKLDGCELKYKNKLYPLTGLMKADTYRARFLTDFSITKNPTNSNTIELIDTDGAVLDKLEYPNGQRKGTSYAFIGYDAEGEELWRTTYAPTPGEPNNYQEFKTCESGKVINEATGNCVKVTAVTEKVCAEGQYLNPLTGRCRKIETPTVTTCKDGYYYNEETGRCRKITENTGADYSLTPETYEESSSFVGLYALLGVVGLGVIYVIYEYRHELAKLFKKFFKH